MELIFSIILKQLIKFPIGFIKDMKKFSVLTKEVLLDFTLTNNLWLTFNEDILNYHFRVRDNKNELLIELISHSLHQDKTEKNEEHLKKYLNNLKNFFVYLNIKDNIIEFAKNKALNLYYYKRNLKKFLYLFDNKHEFSINNDDILVAFNNELNQNEILKLIEILNNNQSISYSVLKEINDEIKLLDQKKHPIFIIDFSPNQSYKFTIKSTLKTVSLAIDMIKNKVLKYKYEKIWQIETVLHEALVNAITYGNELDPEKDVYIYYEIGNKGLRIIIKDLGDGFNVNDISIPIGQEALNQISGRGIYIMKKFSNYIYYNNKGNEVLLFFLF